MVEESGMLIEWSCWQTKWWLTKSSLNVGSAEVRLLN